MTSPNDSAVRRFHILVTFMEPGSSQRIGQRRSNPFQESSMGRGILLWLLGVPIPIIILLALFMR